MMQVRKSFIRSKQFYLHWVYYWFGIGLFVKRTQLLPYLLSRKQQSISASIWGLKPTFCLLMYVLANLLFFRPNSASSRIGQKMGINQFKFYICKLKCTSVHLQQIQPKYLIYRLATYSSTNEAPSSTYFKHMHTVTETHYLFAWKNH